MAVFVIAKVGKGRLSSLLKDFEIKRASSVVVCTVLCKTNRFHVAVRLFSNWSQMTSKCNKNKKVTYEAIDR